MKIKLISLLSVLLILTGCGEKKQSTPEETSIEEASRIHKEAFTLDSHTDTPLTLSDGDFDLGEYHDAKETGSRLDFPRMEAGNLDAVFFAVFTGQGPLDNEGYKKAYDRANSLLDKIYDGVGKHKEMAGIVTTPEEALALEKEGKKAVFIGMENGYPIAGNLDRVKEFYDRGTRYITLCHTKNNQICDSSTDPDSAEDKGVSPFGEKVIAEMNRLGIMVDVSHVSDSSFFDAIRLSKTPVIASHSGVRGVYDHPRNISDEMLKALAEDGGVLQICIFSGYLKEDAPNPQLDSATAQIRKKYNNFEGISEEKMKEARKEWYQARRDFPSTLATVEDLADHIDYAVKLAGVDHVGIGSDFDGGGGIEGVYDVSEMGNITYELLRRGYSEEDVKKIWGGNFLRVFREAASYAKNDKN